MLEMNSVWATEVHAELYEDEQEETLLCSSGPVAVGGDDWVCLKTTTTADGGLYKFLCHHLNLLNHHLPSCVKDESVHPAAGPQACTIPRSSPYKAENLHHGLQQRLDIMLRCEGLCVMGTNGSRR